MPQPLYHRWSFSAPWQPRTTAMPRVVPSWPVTSSCCRSSSSCSLAWLHAYSTQVWAAQERQWHMIACILYTGADNTGKTLAHDCPQHTLHRYGQHNKDIGTWLHAYCTLVRTAQERHWHMIARILYTGSDSTRYTLAHDCTHTLHRYAQHKKDIDTYLHAYSTQVRTAQKRHWHAVACILYIGPCHMIAHIVYTGEDSTWKTLAPDCTHTLHK